LAFLANIDWRAEPHCPVRFPSIRRRLHSPYSLTGGTEFSMFASLRNRAIDFLRCEDGATSVEYAINVALIATVIVSSLWEVGHKSKQTFTKVSNSIENTTGS
jgi:Flp pilus assembly pilin Flp